MCIDGALVQHIIRWFIAPLVVVFFIMAYPLGLLNIHCGDRDNILHSQNYGVDACTYYMDCCVFIYLGIRSWLRNPVCNMEDDGPGYALIMVSPLKTNLGSIVVYETSCINAITPDDVELVRQLVDSNENISSIGLTHVVGKRGKTSNYTLLPYTSIKCKLACTTYATDNIWCLAAIYNSRKVLQFLAEQRLNANGATSHVNN